jgi:hypothetical protein
VRSKTWFTSRSGIAASAAPIAATNKNNAAERATCFR